jgi:uncharacterized protein
MPNPKYAAYRSAAPYFDLVREALGALVDGDHFFDIVTDDTIYEVLYEPHKDFGTSRLEGSYSHATR